MRLPADLRRRELRALFELLHADPRSPLGLVAPHEVLVALDGALDDWLAKSSWQRSWDELTELYRRELALVLREAALLRSSDSSHFALYPYTQPDAGHLGAEGAIAPMGSPALACEDEALLASTPAAGAQASDWLRSCLSLLQSLELDGIELPDCELLVLCICRPQKDWPRATELAEAALLAEDCADGRLLLGELALTEGHGERARAVFQALLEREGGDGLRWRALEGLAAAHELSGCDTMALSACEAALRVPGCGPGAAVAQVFLACSTGDEPRARRAAHRLDACVRESDARFAPALDRLALRVELLRGGLPWRAPSTAAGLVWDLACGEARDQELGGPCPALARPSQRLAARLMPQLLSLR